MEDEAIKILKLVVNYRKIDGIYNTNEVVFKAIETVLQSLEQKDKRINELEKDLIER